MLKKIITQLFRLSHYHLMPMGNGTLFLPVKAEIRKKIRKNEGDWVHITLYSQELPKINPEDFYVCLLEDPVAQANFYKLPEKEQTELIEWMYAPKNEQLKVERMAKALDKLSR